MKQKRSLSVVALCFFLMVGLSWGEQIVTDKDGNSILLKDDHTWEYLDGALQDKDKKKMLEVRTVKNLIDEKLLEMQPPINFYGCIIDIEYRDKDPFEREERALHTVTIGGQKKQIEVQFEDKQYYEGESGIPELDDCRAFRSGPYSMVFTHEGNIRRGYVYGATIVDGNYYVEDKVLENPLYKNRLTVDEYFDQNIQYSGRKMTLRGIVNLARYSNNFEEYQFILVGATRRPSSVVAKYPRERWDMDPVFVKLVREELIARNDEILIKGIFGSEAGTTAIFHVETLLEINGKEFSIGSGRSDTNM